VSNVRQGGVRPDPWRSRSSFIAMIAAVALVIGGLSVWRQARRVLVSPHPMTEGRLEVAGLDAPLEIVRDRRGVPHVRARSERDAWFGLGFSHAQDRLAHLLWLRRLVQGRSAEHVGRSGLLSDRWARTLDLAGLAKRNYAAASRETRSALEAYSAGVNAWLAQLAAGVVAPPLATLEVPGEIELWRPEDSLAIAKQHAWSLADPVAEILVLEQVVRSLGAGPASGLFPEAPARAASQAPAVALSRQAVERLVAPRRESGLAGASIGSAAWLLAGEGTRRGRPLLGADLHFPPRAPGPVYEAHLRGGELEVAGATLPGIPAFWVGFNPDLAWALVHAPVVVADLFEETLYAEDTRRYLDAGKWRSLRVREETIRVAGGPPRRLLVRSTARGPLLDELIPEAGRPLALRWTGALGGGLDGLVRLAHAPSVGAGRAALRAHAEPVAAALLADASGAGLLQLVGAVPRRRHASGLQPVPATNPAYDWTTHLGLEELPLRTLGAGTPWLVAADSALGGAGIEMLWRPGARTRQLEALLAAAAERGRPELADLVGLQQDATSSLAQQNAANLLALMDGEAQLGREEREVLALLREWDGSSVEESRGAAAYHVLAARLLPMLLAPALGQQLADAYLALPRVPEARLLATALETALAGGDADVPWAEPGLVRASLVRGLRETWLALNAQLGASREKWTWGRLHRVTFAPRWPGAWQGDASPLGPFPIRGDDSSVFVSEYGGTGEDFGAEVVPGYRLLADAGNLDQALTAFAPGQSEHPGHPHATSEIARWRAGKPSLLSTSDPVIEDGAVQVLRLEPGP
jgi:penicillin amidase